MTLSFNFIGTFSGFDALVVNGRLLNFFYGDDLLSTFKFEFCFDYALFEFSSVLLASKLFDCFLASMVGLSFISMLPVAVADCFRFISFMDDFL
jgi:hypothetical protein